MKRILQVLLETQNSVGPLILRIALAVAIFPHGAQKLLGWFGGNGFEGTMGYFTSQGIPWIFAFLAISAEFFGAIGLFTGILTRIAAFGIGVTMLVAASTTIGNGFFMNWSGTQNGEGFEYHLLAVGIAIALIVMGAGKFSGDQKLAELINRDSE